MKISIIAAIGRNRELGKDNQLLFKIPEDFKRMSALTRNHPIVMGRKTFLSIGRILPQRTNIVITRDPQRVKDISYYSPEVIITASLAEGIERAKESPGSDEVFIFGGGEIFGEAIKNNLVDKLYLTVVDGDFEADTFFPDYSEFKKKVFERAGQSEGHKYKFVDLEK